MKRQPVKGVLKSKKVGTSKSKKDTKPKPVARIQVSEENSSSDEEPETHAVNKYNASKYKRMEEQKAIRKLLSGSSPSKVSISILKDVMGRDLVMSKSEIGEYIGNFKDSLEFIKIDGKKYKKGDTVEVGAAPYVFYPHGGGRKKKGKLGDAQAHRIEGLIENDIIAPDDPTGDDGEPKGITTEADFGEVDYDKIDTKIKGDYGDDDDEEGTTKKGYFDNDVLGGTSKDDTGGNRSRVKGDTVKEHDFEFKLVSIFEEGGEEEKIAIDFGLDVKRMRLVRVEKRDKAKPDAKVMFGHYDKYDVVEGKHGQLRLEYHAEYGFAGQQHYKMGKNKDGTMQLQFYAPLGYTGATKIDKQMLIPKDISVKAPSLPTIPQPPKSYKGKLRFGNCVTYTDYTQVEQIKGIVTAIDDFSFNVISIGESPKRYIGIPYSHVSHIKTLKYPEEIRGDHKDQIIVGNVTVDIDSKKCVSKACKKMHIKPNTFIEFKKTKIIRAGSGYITGFTDTSFIIISKTGVAIIPYTHKVTKSACPKKIHHLKFKPVNIEDVLNDPVIVSTRERVKTTLFELLSKLFEPKVIKGDAAEVDEKFEKWVNDHPKHLYISDVERDASLAPLAAKIDWVLHDAGILEWNKYYHVEFNRWLYSKYEPIIIKDKPDFTQDARAEYDTVASPDYATEIINFLTDKFGDTMFDGNGVEFLNNIENIANKPEFEHTVLTSFIRTEFNRIPHDKLLEFEGKILARVITRCIMKYRQIYNRTIDELITIFSDQWMHDQFEKIKATSKDQEEFNQQYLVEISDNYQYLKYTYEENEKLIVEYDAAKDVIKKEYASRSILVEEGGVNLNGKMLSEEGIKLYEDIVELERKIYDLHGKNLGYLSKVHEILLFIDPKTRPGKYSTFFRSKIASEHFPVKYLDSSTIYHAFPEFFINEELSDVEFQRGVKLLKDDLYNAVADFAHFWILQHITSMPTLPTFVNPHKKEWKDLNDWSNYTIVVPSKCAESGALRIKKNALLTGTIDNINDYECEPINNTTSKCTAKRELISSDDVILCYSDKRFVCLSINDVLYALSDRRRGEPIVNPTTGEPYTEEFLDRMEDRYGDLIDDKTYKHRVLEFNIETNKLDGKKLTRTKKVIPKKQAPKTQTVVRPDESDFSKKSKKYSRK